MRNGDDPWIDWIGVDLDVQDFKIIFTIILIIIP